MHVPVLALALLRMSVLALVLMHVPVLALALLHIDRSCIDRMRRSYIKVG